MDRISYLLNGYLDNTCTRQEMDEFLDYVQKYPEDEHLKAALQDGWETENSLADTGEPAWKEMQKSLRDLSATKNIRYSQGFFLKVAASLLAIAVCAGAVFYFSHQNKNTFLAENQHSLKNSVKTTKEEHRLIALSDGSKVWINSNSELAYAPAFNDQTREVTLHGEAFFDIRHDPHKPFIIKTGNVKTTVLGTAFNIRAFPGENVVTVTVARGKVRVEGKNNEGGTITENQQLILSLRSEQPKEQEVDAGAVSQWTKDDLILDDVTLGEVEEILEARYLIDIRFDNELLRTCRFTSTFFQNASLDQVLTAICLVNGAVYDIQDKVVTIQGNGCDEKRSNVLKPN